MIDPEKYTYMLQCYTCYKCYITVFGIKPRSVFQQTSPPPNYWKISGKTTYEYFSDLCTVNLMYHF